MSFTKMEKPELLQVAETFGVEVDGRWGEERIRAEILNDGIDWAMWEDAQKSVDPELIEQNLEVLAEDEPEEEPVVPDTTQRFKSKNAVELLKMERWNPSFSILGYEFTREHPFVLMKPEDATWIMSHEEGFRIATPQEAEAFYK
jgi:hypothetical protein